MSPPMQQLLRNLHLWTEDSSEHSFVKKNGKILLEKNSMRYFMRTWNIH